MSARRTRVKICGLTRPGDVTAAVAAGVDALGFNCARGPRRRDPAELAPLVRAVPPPVQCVALFVDADEDTILEVMRVTRCTAVQLHGDEPPELAERLRRRFPVIKAWRVRDADSLDAAADYPCDLHLFDAWVDGAHGGTGTGWDWSLLQDWRGGAYMLAGGLRPDNVGQAVRALQPYAVDTASGVESAPGAKEALAIAAFITAVQEADHA